MTGESTKVYRVKPLVWEYFGDGTDFAHVEVFNGSYQVCNTIHRNRRRWEWKDTMGNRLKCDSLEQGKQLCQQHWERELVAKGILEVVTTNDPPA